MQIGEHNAAISTSPSPSKGADMEKLRKAVGEVVGSHFYGTLLRSVRESTMKGAYGHGGRGEDVFGAQLDGVISEKLGWYQRGGLTDQIYRRLEKQQLMINEGSVDDPGWER